MDSIAPWRLRQMAHELIVICFRAVHGDEALQRRQDAPGLTILSSYPEECEPSAWAAGAVDPK